MNKKIYMACGAAMLAMACSEENLSGTSIGPNTIQAEDRVLWDPQRGDYRVQFAASVLALPGDVEADGRWYGESYSDAKKEAYRIYHGLRNWLVEWTRCLRL